MAPKKRTCPNPLFLKWLEEWKAEAEKKGVNAKFTYAKAIASIKKYPLPLRSGKEAKILENIGDGIANRLDKALAEFIDNGGDLTNPFGNMLEDDLPDLPSLSPAKKKPRKRKAIDVDGQSIGLNQPPIAGVDFCPNAKFAKTNTREYLPAYRSGGYALIITLYQECQKPEYLGYMSKGELQEKAQHLADNSFTMADAGSHYTAWSSMGTLVKKGYVLKTSSPAKYSITDSGCALANKLLTTVHNASGNFDIHSVDVHSLPTLSDTNVRPNAGGFGNKKINGGREALPRAGAGLLSEFQSMKNQRAPAVTSSNMKPYTNSPSFTMSRGSSSFTQTVGASSSTSNTNDHSFTILMNNDSLSSAPRTPQSGGQRLGNRTPNVLHLGNRYAKLQEQISAKAKLKNEFQPTVEKTLQRDTSLPSVTGRVNTSSSVTIFDNENFKDTPSTLSNSSFQYVTDSEALTLMKDRAAVTIDNEIGLGFLVKTNCTWLERSGKLYKIDLRKCEPGSIFAFLADKDAPDKVPPPSQESHSSDNHYDLPRIEDVKKRINDNQISTISRNVSKAVNIDTNIVDECHGSTSSSALSKKQFHNENAKSSNVVGSNKDNIPSIVRQLKDLSDAELKPLFVIKPASFDVILLVDMVETGGYSGGKGKKKEVSDKLTKSGIPMDIRKLQVGDFMWIAKEKYGAKRELVLDFIVERKRMDDLAGSITDGRFREQKFRLKRSGLKHCVYLIEKYGSMQHLNIPESTLRQAITNTQVVDKLFIKETNDVTDTVEYLTLMTAELKNIYADKTLHTLPSETVKLLKENTSFEDVISNDKQYLMTYEEFSANTVKNKVLTVKQVFATQLMQLNGVSIDRALAIVEKYPTPSILMAGYQMTSSIYDKENMLTNIEFGRARRKVGAPISKQIYYLYCMRPQPS